MNGYVFFQFLGGDNIISWVVWIIFFMVFFLFYPKLMTTQIVWKIEKVAKDLERMTENSKGFLEKEISKTSNKRVRASINRFYEFFLITPIDLDPYGVVKKFDRVIRDEREKFGYFVKQLAPQMHAEKRASIEMGIAAGITLNQISKIVRHYVELIKQTKSMQIAMILQMQLPLIERLAKSMYKGSQALSRGQPIGDSIGPMVVAHLIGTKEARDIGDEIVMAKIKLYGRNVTVLKAKGPGGRIGYPGKAVQRIIKNNKITRLITIDAAAKLEGEKTGSVAEGVGVAMGGPGVERSYIEDITVTNNIPLDSIIVKMSQEEAITPMRKAIKDSIPEVREALKRSLETTKRNDNIMILGVGNTSGIGNSSKDLKKVEKWVESYERKLKEKKKKK
ncbi:MAG: DUF1512 domain-containing protein [Nanoarchaeota archaeon]|nr:DUF1512 domain-containing protein [Nanoarchaeota archaeon]MBU1135314.1 DUF1512 domain-containing protein [Nanoarchaeota archaeon]MBU2520040.1 DUF1512 domain-containing protein [Nanoarchaeota archaeon]